MKTSILDALQRFGQLTPEKLKGQTDMNIDDFYKQIKQLVEQNLIEEVRKDGEVYLGVINHANR